MNTLRAGDEGVDIEVTITSGGGIFSIQTATVKEIVFVSPTGARLAKTAAFSTDGKDGRLKYTTVAADFTEVGRWSLQAHITIGGKDLRSTEETLEVRAAL